MLIIQALIALGTLSIAVMAIWGAPIRAKFLPPKVTIIGHNLEGILTRYSKGPKVIYYHLKVENHRLWLPVKECRVLLKQISKKGPDGQFHFLPLKVPHQFIWSPKNFTPFEITVTKEQTFDFGHLDEAGDRWLPELYWYPNNFEGWVGRNEVVRYSLEISGVGCSQNRYQVFEVSWDGVWKESIDEMKRHLTIHEIVSTSN